MCVKCHMAALDEKILADAVSAAMPSFAFSTNGNACMRAWCKDTACI